ncbi:ciliogenesis and planar polarity effector 2-like [Babylonia areolata]|uniref:ciliogenesis and planar polarity effector 2-like n=1 Tax=Babylonia areolata TaxID=304850 RepID=UPI003FD15744
MLVPGSLLDLEWLRSNEGSQLLNCLLHRNGTRFRQFGLLEGPPVPSHMNIEEVSYKVMLVGKTGVGKTSTVAKLTGNDVPLSHNETPGLQTSHVFWPGKIKHLGKTVLFNIQLFDAGETALKRYDHILPACQDGVDAMMFLFSFVDKGSFDEIPQHFTRLTNPGDGISKIILGTKFDLHAHSEVTQRDIRDLESHWQIPVLRIRNVQNSQQAESSGEGLGDVIPVLNTLCEHLWHRDIVLSGRTL